MDERNKLTISEFSRLTGIKRENLRFYDRIQLLSPEYRGENNYRYYSRHQLNSAFLISGLRMVGVSIEEIKQYAQRRSPKESLLLFSQQDKRIQAEIKHLQETRTIMKVYRNMIEAAMKYEKEDCFLEYKKKEDIFLCPPIPSHMNEDDGSVFSYEYAESNGINVAFPQGLMVNNTEEGIHNGVMNEQYYFKVEKGGNASKPEGLYAIAYGRGDPWNTKEIYHRLFRFMKQEGLRMCSAIYEEYPLSDLSVHSFEDYTIRLEVQVQKENT